jgi:hypothetical protein
MSQRGVVIAPKFLFDGRSLKFPGLVGIEPISLRQYLVYWDKIEYPQNNIIHIGNSPDIQFLVDADIMTRSDIRISGSGNIGFAYILAQVHALKIKNQQEPGQWSLAQACDHIFIPEELSTEVNTIEFELYRAVPVPSESVSLSDILEFKGRYHSELLAFRGYMDELYEEVIKSNDIPRSKIACIDRLQRSIEDLQRIANESWSSRILSTLKVELNIPNLVIPAIVGSTVAMSFNLSPEIGSAIGAIAGVLKFDMAATRKVGGLPDNIKELAYLHKIDSELNA